MDWLQQFFSGFGAPGGYGMGMTTPETSIAAPPPTPAGTPMPPVQGPPTEAGMEPQQPTTLGGALEQRPQGASGSIADRVAGVLRGVTPPASPKVAMPSSPGLPAHPVAPPAQLGLLALLNQMAQRSGQPTLGQQRPATLGSALGTGRY